MQTAHPPHSPNDHRPSIISGLYGDSWWNDVSCNKTGTQGPGLWCVMCIIKLKSILDSNAPWCHSKYSFAASLMRRGDQRQPSNLRWHKTWTCICMTKDSSYRRSLCILDLSRGFQTFTGINIGKEMNTKERTCRKVQIVSERMTPFQSHWLSWLLSMFSTISCVKRH